MKELIDLGHEHYLEFVAWKPDRDLNPHFSDIPDNPRCGANIKHPRKDNGQPCEGYIGLDSKLGTESANWKIEQEFPLTLSPSILCSACGDHGSIRNGKWEAD